MNFIARTFVETCEFKDAQFCGLDTEGMVRAFFDQRSHSAEENPFAILNLVIYVIERDAKLLELRP